MGYCLGLAPRLSADFIRSFIIGTSHSAHSIRRSKAKRFNVHTRNGARTLQTAHEAVTKSSGATAQAGATRIEHDLLGDRAVPADA